MKTPGLILTSLLLGGYALHYVVRQQRLLTKTSIKPLRYRIQKLDGDDTRMTIDLAMTNGTDINCKVWARDLALSIGSNRVGTASVLDKAVVPARSTTTFTAALAFSPKKAVASGLKGLFGDYAGLAGVVFRIQGHLTVTAGLFIGQIPINIVFNLREIVAQ
ncbi:MAG TPA: LEA type 2 family protein [Sedimentisphaerales bacterium]|nr:LEA type 2 family protein [Sedimentisphaerales bacterium]